LTETGTEAEAAVVCGYLESCGIRATYDTGGVLGPVVAFPGTWASGADGVGRQEILVRSDDLQAARAALEQRPR
jgi:hypothetical protein